MTGFEPRISGIITNVNTIFSSNYAAYLLNISELSQTIPGNPSQSKKCHPKSLCLDLNPRPLEHDSAPITTRHGLP